MKAGIIRTNTILDAFVEYNEERIARDKKNGFLSRYAVPEQRPSFVGALRTQKTQRQIGLIAEIKQASPSTGMIRDVAPTIYAQQYEKAGATVLSVLTQPQGFNGSFADLHQVRSVVSVPVLCKEFIIDPFQITQAALCGASAVLLIARLLESSLLAELQSAAQEQGLDTLVEVHSAADISKCTDTMQVIGVNARDLTTMQVDLSVVERLLPQLPTQVIRVAESGIQTAADVQRIRAAGADAALVGTALMRSDDPGKVIRSFL